VGSSPSHHRISHVAVPPLSVGQLPVPQARATDAETLAMLRAAVDAEDIRSNAS
jgi:hypothetical protein